MTGVSLGHVTIVLSRPSEARNIGAACRAMKNAGISRLVIAVDGEIDFAAARPLAAGAADVLDAADVVPTLEEAIAGASLVAGITRRTGQRRKTVSFTPWELAGKVVALARKEGGPSDKPGTRQARTRDPEAQEANVVAAGGATVVFGNEQSGLSDAELELCTLAVAIPSAPEQPSLNLSHAVQIICYELYLAELGLGRGSATAAGTPVGAADPSREFASRETLETEVARITAALNALGFLTQEGPQGMPALLRDILGRALVSPEELSRLTAMFKKLEGMHR